MDRFQDMSLEQITAALADLEAQINELFSKENPTGEDLTAAQALAADIREHKGEIAARAAAENEVKDGFAALRGEFAGEGEDEDPEGEESEEGEEPEEAEEPAEGEEPAEEPAPVEAGAKTTKAATKGVKALARKTPRPARPAADTTGPVTITAAENVPGFSTGKRLDLGDVATAVINRARGFSPPTGSGEGVNLQKFGTAALALDIPADLMVDRFDDAQEVIERAGDESRLSSSSGSGSLTAAGGWCAPSETLYDLTDDSTGEGLLSLPEIGVKRGGIRFAQSPNFADFYANPGFIQTETQAIAGTTKPCVEVDCPDFTEVRLDAEGICIKVPILTNAAYPEVVRNFISGTMNAHLHWINANVIGRLVTASGAARVFAGKGASTTDTLESVELVINQTRQKYRLSMRQSLEVVLPFWVKGAFRADISRRTGQLAPVTDQQIMAHFAAIGAAVQFVYDWQAIDETAEVYPATFQALVYPAGTFVKGTAPVINLSTVYDAASLATNVYTGLFFEQGLLVAKKKFHSDLITIPLCNAGRTGAANLTCA